MKKSRSLSTLIIFLLGFTFIYSVSKAQNVLADSYDVTASIPYEAPTIAATVTAPLDNSTVRDKNLIITGTCEMLSPSSVVSVWRSSTLLGSTSCQVGGSYSIEVSLSVGSNYLVIRTSSLSSNYGPDSTVLTVYYYPAETAPGTPSNPTTPGVSLNNPTKPSQNNGSQPQITPINELLITSPSAFGVIENNTISITLTLSGGVQPYKLLINWGDGTTFSQDIERQGDYTFTHKYESAKTYSVNALLTDARDVSRSFNWVAISGVPLSLELIGENDNLSGPKQKGIFGFYACFVISLIVLFIFITTFLLGRYYQARKYRDSIVNKIPKKKMKK